MEIADTRLVQEFLDRWQLRPDGAAMSGTVATVLPVRLEDGARAVLKVQPVDDETAGEADALRAWDGRGAVRLMRHDPASGAMLLERLDPAQTLTAMPDEDEAVRVVGELLVRLNSVAAPVGMRRLTDVVEAMLDLVPKAMAQVQDQQLRSYLDTCGQAAADLLPAPDDRLLHWDLHFDNVLRADSASDRAGQWLAIDPKPLAGESGFELLPALRNRWDHSAAATDTGRAVMRRFDLMTEIMGLDRQRTAAWTLVRVLQNLLWDFEDGNPFDPDQPDVVIATILLRTF